MSKQWQVGQTLVQAPQPLQRIASWDEERVLEVRGDPVAHGGRVDLEVGGDALAGGRALVVGLAAERVGLDVAGEARRVGLQRGRGPCPSTARRRSRRRPA